MPRWDKVPEAKRPAKAKKSTPAPAHIETLTEFECIHRGKVVGSIGCNTCGQRGTFQEIHECTLFGKCTLRRHNTLPTVEPTHHCITCHKRELPKMEFARVVCISLARRADRWEKFVAACPYKNVEKFTAIDGKLCTPPDWWKQGAGAWGCYKSHLAILEKALNDGVESLLVFEDDAIFCENYVERSEDFLAALPPNWGLAYLGGQHLNAAIHPPIRLNDLVVQPYNVNRTHAMAYRGRDTMLAIYRHISAIDGWTRGQHIDHYLGKLAQKRSLPIYAPTEWLVGQSDSASDINVNVMTNRFWNGNDKPIHKPTQKWVVVLGTHASGSSALAGVLHRLGVHMGQDFHGAHNGGYEDDKLARLCEQIFRFPTLPRIDGNGSRSPIKRYLGSRSGPLVGIKYPHLCALTRFLGELLPHAIYVAADRPLEESIASLIRRENGRHKPERLEALQRKLHAEKETFLENRPCVRVSYSELLASPDSVIDTLAKAIGLTVSDAQRTDIKSFIDPTLRHISLDTAGGA